jgi:putative ABC transport system substrate-binding protein
MRRREFMTLLGCATTWPLTARAQQPTMPVIGVLYGISAAERAEHMAAFRRGLAETGFVEGRNVAIEYRWAEGQYDRMAWMAVDLVSRRIAVMLIGGNTTAVRAMIAAAQSMPIVFTTGIDPVAADLVTSLNQPGGNATGLTIFSSDLGPKKLELLHEIAPTARTIGLLMNPNNRIALANEVGGVQTAAKRLGLETIVLEGGTESAIETAFASAVQKGAGAVFIFTDLFLQTRRQQIAALALRHKLPTVTFSRENVLAGQLISYGADDLAMYQPAGIYVGRILKGAKPADLPVQGPTKFDLAINLKTAKALGLTIPDRLLALADEVIE